MRAEKRGGLIAGDNVFSTKGEAVRGTCGTWHVVQESIWCHAPIPSVPIVPFFENKTL
jgi:hypothetical protein